MRYKVTPGHIFAYDDNQGIDIFEITLWKRWNYWANIIQTEEQYISILEENRELYDNVLRRYEPINQSGVYAYDLVYSQKHKNHLPFPHHARENLVGQYLSKKLTTLVRNGIVRAVIFPPNHQEKNILQKNSFTMRYFLSKILLYSAWMIMIVSEKFSLRYINLGRTTSYCSGDNCIRHFFFQFIFKILHDNKRFQCSLFIHFCHFLCFLFTIKKKSKHDNNTNDYKNQRNHCINNIIGDDLNTIIGRWIIEEWGHTIEVQ